ncbi:YgjP-like metallopeptidase domain-containing protein, partial [Campylobacter volucris]|uniref:YgjP-like metallopeptidase domain-containing protein n=1 Tax=Campylobacter volucris TaxID=1031542 RepID=UPI0018A001BE
MAKQDISLKGKFNFKNLNIDFERKKVKYLRLKIDRTLNFKLTIPLHYKDKDVLIFLEKNEIWIKNKQKEILSKKTLLSDNEVYFLDKKYHLVFDENYQK